MSQTEKSHLTTKTEGGATMIEVKPGVWKIKRDPEKRTYGKKYNRKLLRGVIKEQTGKSKLVNAIFHRRNGGTRIESNNS